MIHAFFVSIGVIAAIALAPIVIALVRNPLVWIGSFILALTVIVAFIVIGLATAPHTTSEPGWEKNKPTSYLKETPASTPALSVLDKDPYGQPLN